MQLIEPWEKRLASLVGDPRVPRVISDDVVKCLAELHHLRELVKTNCREEYCKTCPEFKHEGMVGNPPEDRTLYVCINESCVLGT